MKRMIMIVFMAVLSAFLAQAWETTDNYTQVLRHSRYQASYNVTVAPTSNSFIFFASGNQAVPVNVEFKIMAASASPEFGAWSVTRYKGPIKWTNGTVYTNTAFAADYHATIFEKVSGIYDLQDQNYFGGPYPQPLSCWEYTYNATGWTVFTNAWGGNGISNRGTATASWNYNIGSGGVLTQTLPTPIVIGANTHEFLIISNMGGTGSNLTMLMTVQAYIGR